MPLFYLLVAAAIGVFLWRKTEIENELASDLGDSLSMEATAYVDGNPVQITIAPIGTSGGRPVYLRLDAATAFLAMQKAALKDAIILVPSGPRAGFRTPEQQQSLVAEEGLQSQGGLAGRVGRSHHQNGICVDITVHSSRQSDEYRWLERNASQFGFVNTGVDFPTPEFWHWEYVA